MAHADDFILKGIPDMFKSFLVPVKFTLPTKKMRTHRWIIKRFLNYLSLHQR